MSKNPLMNIQDYGQSIWMDDLAALDIVLDELTAQLEQEGIEKFVQPYDSLIETLKKAAA